MLNQLHSRYASKGLSILAFPCNAFGGQEPGSPEEIFAFATSRKSAKFDLFRKVEVNGPSAHPLFKWLIGDPGGCMDDDANCPAWADAGECKNNEAFMSASCKRSCKICTSSAASPIKWNFESFVVSRTGQQVARWATGADITSASYTKVIEDELAKKDEM